jgi:hypothetical protein
MARFNHPSSRVFLFLITTTAGGVGVTLTGANHVVFFDTSWNPQADLQAQDRAHRIGQTRVVHVHRLAVAGSVEDTVMKRTAKKLTMSEFVTDGIQHEQFLRRGNNNDDDDDDDDSGSSSEEGDGDDDADCSGAKESDNDDDDAIAEAALQIDSDDDEDMIAAKRMSLGLSDKKPKPKPKQKKQQQQNKKKVKKTGAELALRDAGQRLDAYAEATTNSETIKQVLKEMMEKQRREALQSPTRRARRQRGAAFDASSSAERKFGAAAAASAASGNNSDDDDAGENDDNDGEANKPRPTQQQRDQMAKANELVARMFEAIGGDSKAEEAPRKRVGNVDAPFQASAVAQGTCFTCGESAHPSRLLHCSSCVKSYHMTSRCLVDRDIPRSGQTRWSCPRHTCFMCEAHASDAVMFAFPDCPHSYCIDCLPAGYLSLAGSVDGLTLPLISKTYEGMEEDGMVPRRLMRYIMGQCPVCEPQASDDSSDDDKDDAASRFDGADD